MTAVVENEERVSSVCEYSPAFMGLKPLREQIEILVEVFGVTGAPALRYIEGMEEKNPKPDGFEGWVAVPKIDAVARNFFRNEFSLSEKDRLGIELVLRKIQEFGRPVNNQLTNLRDLEFRRSDRSFDAFYILGRCQPGDIVVFPAQLGVMHRGYSPRGARTRFHPGEFEIDAFSGACVLLTHPERIRSSKDLFMVCSGSEVLDTHPIMMEKGIRNWNPVYFYGDGFSEHTPEVLGVHSIVPDFTHERYGSATGLMV